MTPETMLYLAVIAALYVLYAGARARRLSAPTHRVVARAPEAVLLNRAALERRQQELAAEIAQKRVELIARAEATRGR